MAPFFNLSGFCNLAGNVAEINDKYRLALLIITIGIAILILVTNGFVLITIARNRSTFLNKSKVFVISLVLIEVLCGSTLVPLFITELNSKRPRDQVECSITSWRVISFIYFMMARMLCIFMLSFHSYIKTCRQATKLEYWFDRYIHAINILGVWSPGLIAIVAIGYSNIKPGPAMGTFTLTYFILLIASILACYILVLKSINKAKNRHNSDIYATALKYIKAVLIWFIITNILLMVCGFVLLVYAFYPVAKQRHYVIVQQIYMSCLLITVLDAIINPVLFVQTYVSGICRCLTFDVTRVTGIFGISRCLGRNKDEYSQEGKNLHSDECEEEV